MFYQSELNYFCNTLEKCHIKTTFLNPGTKLDEQMDFGLRAMFSGDERIENSFLEIVNPIEESTIYKLIDIFSATYYFFLLPNKGV